MEQPSGLIGPLRPPSGSKLLWGKDMEGMFKLIPQDDALAAMRWACSLVKPDKECESLGFAMANGHLKHVDRIRPSCSNQFYKISSAEVLRYISFGAFDNELFVLGPFVTTQPLQFR